MARINEERAIQAKLHESGFAGFTFPPEYGGQGLTLEHERIFAEEARPYRTPGGNLGVSINILGATLAAFGTHEQKLRHLPRILSGAEIWLQLLSEPSGGSDLGRALDQRDPRWRLLRRQRAEDLEHRRLRLGLRPVPGPHPLGCSQAQGHLGADHRPEDAGHRSPPDQTDEWRSRILRGVLHRCDGSGRELGG